MSDQRDWNPVLRGDVYCSPACGADCTKEAFTKSHMKGMDLVRRMGHGWSHRVHENLGWHYMAFNGSFHLHEYADGSYTLLAQGDPQFVFKGTDPHELVKQAVIKLASFAQNASERLDHAKKVQQEIP